MKPSAKTAADRLPRACASLILFFSAAISFAQTPMGSGATADLILKNGRIYPEPDGERGWAQAISIRDGSILTIGTNAAIEKEKSPTTKVIDLKGKVVLPGFNDSHVHLLWAGLAMLRADLSTVRTIAQFQEKLKTYAAANPLKKWILGQGWDHTQLPGQKYPTAADIDAVISDKPVFLTHTDYHLAVVNTKALELLKIKADTANPEGGEIQRDAQGNPTGVLLESAASFYEEKIDKPSNDEIRQALRRALDEATRFGVTSVQGPIQSEDELKLIEEFFLAKQLNVRLAVWGKLEHLQEFIAQKEKYKHLPEEWVRFAALKGFVDGVISARTAALIDPYSDVTGVRGTPNYTQEKLNELVLKANRLGVPVALHAVGDKAVTMAFSSFVFARGQLFNSRIRNRIEHLELTPQYLFEKMAQSSVVASVQPSHMIYDDESKNYNDVRLGKDRVKRAFAWKSFLAAKAHLAFGSDWPVMPINPMYGLFGATFRQHLNGKPANGWQPQQKIALMPAIDAYTLGGAFATREEHVKGSLREGKYADLVVLEQDPFHLRGPALLKTPVALTIVDGKIVYDGNQPQLKPQVSKN